MQWKTASEFRKGDTRTRVIFALLPRDCTDGVTRWLTRVQIKEELCSGTDYEGYQTLRWVEISASPIS